MQVHLAALVPALPVVRVAFASHKRGEAYGTL
jgi:hypothetical protein